MLTEERWRGRREGGWGVSERVRGGRKMAWQEGESLSGQARPQVSRHCLRDSDGPEKHCMLSVEMVLSCWYQTCFHSRRSHPRLARDQTTMG